MIIIFLTLFQSALSTLISYQMTNNSVQAITTLTINVTASFSSNNIQIAITLPSQIPSQDNIVCGINGLAQGSCTLLYSKFYVVFLSAQPSFSITFVNVQNPNSNFSDPVIVNCSVIATSAVLFTQQVQLSYALLNILYTLTGPQATQTTGGLTLSLSQNIKGNILIQVQNGLLSGSITTTSLTSTTQFMNSSQIQLNGSLSTSSSQIQCQILIPSLQPVQTSLTITDSNGYLISQSSQILTATQLGELTGLQISSQSFVFGTITNVTVVSCQAGILSINIPSQFTQVNASYASTSNGCTTTTQALINPTLPGNIFIIIQNSINNYLSSQNNYTYVVTPDTLTLTLTQNSTTINNLIQIQLSTTLRSSMPNVSVTLNQPYQLLSCTSSSLSCVNGSISYGTGQTKAISITGTLTLTGCSQGLISISVYSSGVLIASSNTVDLTRTAIAFQISDQSSNTMVNQNSQHQTTATQNSIIKSYVLSTNLTDVICSSCVNQSSLVSSTSNIQFSATNPVSNQPYQITVQAFDSNQCLLATSTITSSAQPLALKIAATASDSHYNVLSNYTVNITPNLSYQGILRVPLQFNSQLVQNAINSSHIAMSTNSINLINVTNIPTYSQWEFTYITNGYTAAFGSLVLPVWQYIQIENAVITYPTSLSSSQNLVLHFANTLNASKISITNPLYGVNVTSTNLSSNTLLVPITYNKSQTNNFNTIFVITTFDSNNVILQQTTLNQTFNYECQSNCNSCTVSGCTTCSNPYQLESGSCQIICPSNTYLQGTMCLQIPEALSGFYFTPPVLSCVIGVLIIFAVLRRILFKGAQIIVIYYATGSILEHLIQIFLFIWFLIDEEYILAFCMVSIIVIQQMSQIYMILIQVLKIDPEYIGVRQQFRGISILHMLSVVFCGRMMLLLMSRLGQSHIWAGPWSYRINIIEKMQNLLKFQVIPSVGVIILVVIGMLKVTYLFYIEIAVFAGLQLIGTFYAFYYLNQEKTNEMRLTYI